MTVIIGVLTSFPLSSFSLSLSLLQKRHRMIEKQNDLKEVIVHLRTPSGAPPSGPRDLSGKAASAGDMSPPTPEDKSSVPQAPDGEKGCESCFTTTAVRWVSWGPAHEHCRLCGHCYIYWRKYGGLKLPTRWGESVCMSICLPYANSVSLATPSEAVERRSVVPLSLNTGLVLKKPFRDHRPRANKKVSVCCVWSVCVE